MRKRCKLSAFFSDHIILDIMKKDGSQVVFGALVFPFCALRSGLEESNMVKVGIFGFTFKSMTVTTVPCRMAA